MSRPKRTKITISFTLEEEDLRIIAGAEPQWDDHRFPDLETMHKLWSALAEGGEINGIWIEPDHEAYGQFLDKVTPIWNKIKLSPLEQLAEVAE